MILDIYRKAYDARYKPCEHAAAHLAGLQAVAALAGAVPESLRALSEDYARKIDARRAASRAYNDAYYAILKTGRSPNFDELLAERNASQKAEQERDAAQAHLLASCLFLASHPAGQSAGQGAEGASPRPWTFGPSDNEVAAQIYDATGVSVCEFWSDKPNRDADAALIVAAVNAAPDSTRTGAAELRCLINEVADAVFAIGRATLSEQQVDRAYTAAERLLDYRDRNLSAARPEAPSDAGWSQAARDVLAERRRQVEAEGWTPEHDDEHIHGEMAQAAACYADNSVFRRDYAAGAIPYGWPWASGWWKPSTARSDLVKAAALLVAEIERHDRLSASVAPSMER